MEKNTPYKDTIVFNSESIKFAKYYYCIMYLIYL